MEHSVAAVSTCGIPGEKYLLFVSQSIYAYKEIITIHCGHENRFSLNSTVMLVITTFLLEQQQNMVGPKHIF